MMIYEMSVDTTNNISMTMSVVVRSGHLVAIMVMVMATIVAMEAIPMIRLLSTKMVRPTYLSGHHRTSIPTII